MSFENKNEKSASFPSIYKRVYQCSVLTAFLKGADVASVILVAVAYLSGLVFALTCSVWLAAELLALSAVPFVLVSLFRRAFNAPRPYELYDFSAEGITPPGHKLGSSFPSRHVFSAFLIGSLFCFFCIPVGVAVLLLGALLAVCRALLGVHFVRDVIAGGLLGALLGCFGGILVTLI